MILTPDSTSVIKHVFLQDTSSPIGAGKTALVYSDITAYYVRAGGTLTALTMETISTLGTWASSGNGYLGFKLLHDTNAPGLYELHLPNNILASGANQVTIQLRGTGFAPCNIEIQLANVPSALNAIVEGTVTMAHAMQLILAACAGKVDGGGTTTIHFRDIADTKNRITATVDASGNRSAITPSYD